MTRARLLGLGAAGVTATCVPSLGPSDALVASTRILAVRADPPEAAPGAEVRFTSLVASPAGTVVGAPIGWSFCNAPTPPTVSNIVSNACLGARDVTGAGSGPATNAALPDDGCSVFGPDVAAAGLRPTDPDPTGGYYQPVRLELAGVDPTFALVRLHCDLPQASAATASAFQAAYRLNRNPELSPLRATIAGGPVALTAIPRGARVTLEASWPASSAETFAVVAPGSNAVAFERESMQVAWSSNAGALDTESTGRASDDPATFSDNGWTAPDVAGTSFLWLVLRDSRGGVDFQAYELGVGP